MNTHFSVIDICISVVRTMCRTPGQFFWANATFCVSGLVVIALFSLTSANPSYEKFIAIVLTMLIILCLLPLFIMTMVHNHHLFLSEECIDKRKKLFFDNGSALRYLMWLIVIVWLAAASEVVLAGISGIIREKIVLRAGDEFYVSFLSIVSHSVSVYLISRLVLILPSVASGIRKRGLRWAWKMSDRHSIALFFLCMVIHLIFDALGEILQMSQSYMVGVVVWLLWCFMMVVAVGVLSRSYSSLVEKKLFEGAL